MIILAKLHWFRTIHHVDTERDKIAKSLDNALSQAIPTMALTLEGILPQDASAFKQKYLHLLSHWVSTHVVMAGLYITSQRCISGHHYWVCNRTKLCNLNPDEDIIRRLYVLSPNQLNQAFLD